MDKYIISNNEYFIIKLLGHGKGGYSYLVKDQNNKLFVLKKIHHEPCSYYQFGNKIQSEYNDYNILKDIGLKMPKLLYIDFDQEIIIKEYIDGMTIDNLIIENKMKDSYLDQLKKMCEILYKNNLNIDYFPTNFVIQNEVLYYIDYECNKYDEKWNFENWGIKYWSLTEEFKEHFKI